MKMVTRFLVLTAACLTTAFVMVGCKEKEVISKSASVQSNKELIRRHFDEIWNQHHLDLAAEMVSPNYYSHFPVPGQPPGIAGFTYAVQSLHTSFPDLIITIDDLIAEDDKVVARLTARGTHQGDFRGIPPTGRIVQWTGIRIFRLAEGKIVEHWANWDDLSLLQQLSDPL